MKVSLISIFVLAAVFVSAKSFACDDVAGKWNCSGAVVNLSFKEKDGVTFFKVGEGDGPDAESEQYIIDGKKHPGGTDANYTAVCSLNKLQFVTEFKDEVWIHTYEVKDFNTLELSLKVNDGDPKPILCKRIE